MKSFSRFFSCSLSILLLLVLMQSSGRAQDQEEATEVEVHFPITEIVKRDGKNLTVRIAAGREQGLLSKMKGNVWSRYDSESEDRPSGTYLGEGEVAEVEDSISTLTVLSATEQDILPHDLVSLSMLIHLRDYRSIIFDLACLNVTFTGGDGSSLYKFVDVLRNDSREYEERIFREMLSSVHSTAALVKAAPDPDPVFTEPLTGGRFIGKSIPDAMERSTIADIRSFLLYVRAYPAQYMGNVWSIDQTYATWILSNTPIAPDDLREQLMPLNSDADIRKLIEEYREFLADGTVLYDWINNAESWGTEGDVEKGKRLNRIVATAAVMLEDDEVLAWTRFVDARIAEAEYQYENAIVIYRDAEQRFKEVGTYRGESFALNNRASVLHSISRYEEALTAYDSALALKRERVEDEGTPDAIESLAHTVAGRAGTLSALGRNREALDAYDAAVRLYDSAATTNSSTSVAWASMRAASVLSNMGEYESALRKLEVALSIYRQSGNRDGEADVLDEIGYQYSTMGRYPEALRNYEEAYGIHLAQGDKNDAGFSKSSIGQVYWSLGDYYNAEKAHRLAILLREEAEDIAGQAYSWHKLGEMFRESGNPNAALDAYQHASEMYRTLGDRQSLADVLNSTGDLYNGQKAWHSALDRYQEALAVQRETGAQEGIALTLYNIGNVYYVQGDYQKAKEPFEESLKIRESIGDKGGAIYSATGLGLVAWSLRDYAEAKRRFTAALAVAHEIDSKSDIAWCRSMMARVESQKGEYDAALKDYNESLTIYREIGEKSGEMSVLIGIGDIEIQRGNFDEGLARFNEAKRLATETNNRTGLAEALASIAGVHLLLGDFTSAIQADREALKINREVENAWGIGAAFSGIGNIYNGMGEYRQAIDFYQSADSVYRELGDTLGRATPINNTGTIYFFQGDYERALDQFNQVLQILRRAGQEDEFLAIVLSNIGEVYLAQGRYDDAETWLHQALELEEKLGIRRMKSSTLTILTKTLMAQNHLDEADTRGREALTLAKEIGEKEQLAEINAVVGELAIRRNNEKEAEKYLNESVEISEKLGSAKYLWKPLYHLGIIRRNRGDRDAAITTLERSVETIEGLRSKVAGGESAQKLFASDRTKIEVYEALIALLIERGDIEKALGYLERSSSEDLRSRFKGLQPTFADPEKQGILEKGKEMKARIDKLAEQISVERGGETGGTVGKIERLQEIISVAENDYIKFVNETIREQPELRNYFSSGVNPIELRQRKQKIPRDVAVVSYLLGERQIFAFVATPDTVVARVVAAPRADVEWAIRTFCRSVEHPGDEEDVAANADRLYSLLIAPIEDRIIGHDKLAIIPSGDLTYLPFGALKPASDSAHYLMEQYTLFYISDLGVFLDDKDGAATLRVVAFGNADGTLPSAEKEVKEITKLYPGSQMYVGSEATEERAKNFPQGYNVLHFATHGNLDYRHFENSWLTLAPTSSVGDDGRLTLEEIWGITNLADCKLVTLSACNTAVSDEGVEGWPINPANAFLQVGVPRVVATLWQVDDQATAILMEAFYRNLADHGAAEALRLSQQQLASNPKYASPYYWGPFVLLGDWR